MKTTKQKILDLIAEEGRQDQGEMSHDTFTGQMDAFNKAWKIVDTMLPGEELEIGKQNRFESWYKEKYGDVLNLLEEKDGMQYRNTFVRALHIGFFAGWNSR